MTIHVFAGHKPRRAAVFGFCLFFFLLVGANGQAQQNATGRSTKSCLWMVETPTGKLFLLGSLHVLKSSAYPLAAEIERAYAASQTLVFETDLGAMMDPANQSKMLELGVYPEGQDLFQNISAGTRRNLELKLEALGLPPAYFSRFKPWFLAVTLTTLELQRLGFNPLYGIDIHFYNKAKADEKELAYLESIDEQIKLLGNMSAQEQRSFLGQTLKDLDISAQLADDMMTAWQNGATDDLYALLFKSFEDHPGLEDRLLTRRNKDWIQQIESMLKAPKITMVVVGAGHLVGPAGVVEMLKQKGYQVKQQ